MDSGRAGERRALAAIVFTDAVGFTARAAQNEQATLAALQRDLNHFAQRCAEFNGAVVNTMGDGMLMTFASAVDAMKLALQLQEDLFHASRALPREEVLSHRIGVHIGDVVFEGDNVYGDGVNIAARLQQICRPSAIAFSRSIHDLVKAYLPPSAHYLGPRVAKGVAEPIPIWEIPPLAQTIESQFQTPLDSVSTPLPEDGVTGGRSVLAILLMVVVLVVGFGTIGVLFAAYQNKNRGVDSLTQLGGKPRPKRHKSVDETSTSAATNEPANDGSGTNSGVNDASNSGNATSGAGAGIDAGSLDAQLASLRSTYQFAAMVELLKSQPEAVDPTLIQRYEAMAGMRTWADREIQGVTLEELAQELSTAGMSSSIVGNESPNARFDMWALAPRDVLSVLQILDRRAARRSPSPSGSFDLFATEYGITAPATY